MAMISKPILFVALAGVLAALVFAQQEDRPVQKPKAKTKHTKSSSKDLEYTEADYKARFGKATAKVRNLFEPLVVATPAVNVANLDNSKPQDDLDKIPPELANGESGWVFTGFATVNGENMALLENSSTHQGGFVKKGDPWKASRIVRITAQSVVMADPKTGADKVVLRFDPNKPQKPASAATDPNAGVKPVDPGPALRGPIGGAPGGMSIQPSPQPGTVISSGPVIIRG